MPPLRIFSGAATALNLRNPVYYTNLETFLSDNDLRLADQVRDNIAEHLKSLRQQFAEYFPAIAQGNTWMRDPFVIKASDVLEENLSALEQELLIELSCDDTLKSTFRGQTLLDFWMQRRSEYPALSGKAVRFLIPFATTYLCEKGFSSLASINPPIMFKFYPHLLCLGSI